ncbi:MAG: element excision factor XisI family protein [Bacteroidota bacterium]
MGKVASNINLHRKLVAVYLEKQQATYDAYPHDTLEHLLLTDSDNGQFQLTRTGWHEKKFVFQVLIHISVKSDGKIWILQNLTELLLAEDFTAEGVDPQDIVLAFKPEYLRRHTGYGID